MSTVKPRVIHSIGPVLYGREQIAARVGELAAQVSADYADRDLTLLVVLKGAALFGADLARAMTVPCQMDYLPATSYRGMWTTGAVSIGPLRPGDIFDRHVLIVEDIIDSGTTLHALWKHVQELQPASLDVCTLLNKMAPRGVTPPVPLRYVGFEGPDQFVIGYGMDLDEAYRHLPDIHVLD